MAKDETTSSVSSTEQAQAKADIPAGKREYFLPNPNNDGRPIRVIAENAAEAVKIAEKEAAKEGNK